MEENSGEGGCTRMWREFMAVAGLSLGVLVEEEEDGFPSSVGVVLLVTWAFWPEFLALLVGLFLPAMENEVSTGYAERMAGRR